MRSKLKKTGVALGLVIWLATCSFAVTANLQVSPPSSQVESGSNQCYLNIQAIADANIWATGIQASLGGDQQNSGLDSTLFEAVYISSAPINNYQWKGLNIGPQYNGNGTVLCSKFVLSDKEGAPPTGQGIANFNGSVNLYQIQLTAKDELAVNDTGKMTDINLDPTITDMPPGNNSVSYYQTGEYLKANGTHTNASVTIMPANPPAGFAGPSEVLDLETGNTLKISWDTAGVTDLTNPILYDIYSHEGNSFTNPANESKLVPGTNTKNLTSGPVTLKPIADNHPLFKDKTTYYFRMRAKDSSVGTNREKLGIHKTTYTDTQDKYVKSATPHDYTAPASVQNPAIIAIDKTIELKYTTPGNDDFAGIMILKNEVNAALPVLKTPSYYRDTEKLPNQDGDLYKINEILGGNWTVVEYAAKNKNTPYNFVDSNLENGKPYYYLIYTFDTADTYEQGRNYDQGVLLSDFPGEKPTALANFVALSGGPGEITLTWDIPNWATEKQKYGGAVIRYVVDPATKWSTLVGPQDGENFTTKAYDTVTEPQAETISINLLPGGAPLQPDTTYYLKAFAYNRTGEQYAGNIKYAEGVKAASVAGKVAGTGKLSGLKIDFDPAAKKVALSWSGSLAVGHQYEIYKSVDPKVFQAGNLLEPSDTTSSAYILGADETEAYFRVKISGEDSPWAPQTVGVKKIELKKSSTGINSIALPFMKVTSDDIKNALNSQAGKAIVEYVAGWDEKTQTEYARIYSGQEIIDIGGKGNFGITPWVGYQLSISEDITSWWWGEVSGK